MTLKLTKFDAASYLKDEVEIAAFLDAALDSGSESDFRRALSVAAKARGVTKVAKAAGVGRESLYKSLSEDARPEFATIFKVMAALGARFSVQPQKAAKPRPSSKRLRTAA